MSALALPSRWRLRLIGLSILCGAGVALQPFVVNSQASAQSTPTSELSPALSDSVTASGGSYTLTNVSYAPGHLLLAGTTGQALLGGVKIKVEDSSGQPVAGVTVQLEFVSMPKKGKDAEITPANVVSGADGIATANLQLGSAEGKYLIAARADGMTGTMPRVTAKALTSAWWLFLVFGLVGGLGLFLYGMELGSGGLQKSAGAKMRTILEKLTSNRFMGVILGTVTTALVQSSSATTVMVVGFVSAGLMTLVQAIGVIFGANIGTTVTVQLIAFQISDYALLMIGWGFIQTIVTKRKMWIYAGEIILGFGLIFYGMAVMSNAMRPLRDMPVFADALVSLGENPVLGIMVAAAFTGLINSSGATIGLAVVLASQDLITLQAAMPIVLGANIGTTVTTLWAMIGASTEGKRAGIAHLTFNVIGVVVFLPFLGYFSEQIVEVTQSMGSSSIPRQVANGHMLFNVFNTLFFIPLLGPLARLVTKIIPDKPEASAAFKPKYLDNNLLETPEMALTSAYQEVLRVSGIVTNMFGQVMQVFDSGSEGDKAKENLTQRRVEVEVLSEELRCYYTRLAQKNLGLFQSAEKHGQMAIVDDLRQMSQQLGGDMPDLAAILREHGTTFSEDGRKELDEFYTFAFETQQMTDLAIKESDTEGAAKTLLRKDSFADHERRLRNSHLSRLDSGLPEPAATSAIHMDMLTAFRQLGRTDLRICHSLTEFLDDE